MGDHKFRPFWNRRFSSYTFGRTMNGAQQSDGAQGSNLDPDMMLPHTKEAGLGDEIYRFTMDAYASNWPAEEEWQVIDK